VTTKGYSNIPARFFWWMSDDESDDDEMDGDELRDLAFDQKQDSLVQEDETDETEQA